MQIIEIVLYGKSGKTRHLRFQLGKLNIITGEAKSGKSAVGDIIDYCLGSKNCNIADGVVRECVAWFGVLLQFPVEQIFIARENPKITNQTTSSCYYEIGENIQVPEQDMFVANTNIDGIVQILNEHLGIDENMYIPPQGQTRRPITATVRHALNFCFQGQDEIAAKNILFHRQAEPYILQTIKDTLPYFFGAAREDTLVLVEELHLKKRKLKIFEQKKEERELIKGIDTTRAVALLNEAAAVGLVDFVDDIVQENNFEKLVDTLSNCKIENNIVEYSEDSRLISLQKQLDDVLDQLSCLDEEIEMTERYISGFSGYGNEIEHQKARLESIGLFENINFTPDRCPFCSSKLNSQLPEIEALKKAITELDMSLQNITNERPKLQSYVNDLYTKRFEMRGKVSQLRAEIDSVYEIEKNARKVRDINTQKAQVIGRISLWIESIKGTEDDNTLEASINSLQSRIDEIEKLLDQEAVDDKMFSILSKMQTDMTTWARLLELEYSEYPYRYDQKKATVVVDKEKPITLNQLGSGSNWVGVHLITYMAFHKQFIENNRPVPRFLFLDQPSQVYFPTTLDDIDMKAVIAIYEFIEQQVDAHNGKFQVIVVDHAELEEPCFKNNVVEVWRNSNKLVPVEWYTCETQTGADSKGSADE